MKPQHQLAVRMIANAVQRQNVIAPYIGFDHKRNNWFDFGYPSEITFRDCYQLYKRNGIAAAAVDKTAAKTWETAPWLVIGDEKHKETPAEKQIRLAFQKIRFWQKLRDIDRMSLVGKYSAAILRLRDGKPMHEECVGVSGGLRGLVDVIPAWEGQITVSEWETDPNSDRYGKPKMFMYVESAVDADPGKVRQMDIHHSRVVVWSEDGTTHGRSALEPAFNAFIDLEKIRGSGGEGFWKNAKSQPVLQAAPDVDFNSLAQSMGTDMDGLSDALDDMIAKWSKGLDVSLILQGMEAKTLQVDLPNPKEFYTAALNEIAASFSIPSKELTGNQTGERASSEDAEAWSQHNMSRRSNTAEPAIMDIIDRLVNVGVLAGADYSLDWADLTEASMSEKIDRAVKMADVNQKMAATGGPVFTDAEIRDTVGLEPIADIEGEIDDEQGIELEDGGEEESQA